MTKHSPAPWIYDETRCAIRYQLPVGHPDRYDEDDDGWRNVVSLYSACGGVEGNTDVELMTAAPAMLAALRTASVHLLCALGERDPVYVQVRAAIAQAEGGRTCSAPAPPLPLAASILAEAEAVQAEISMCEAGEARAPDDEGWQNMAATARERMAGLVRIAAAAGVTIPVEAGK